MKSFVCIALYAAIFSVVLASPISNGSPSSADSDSKAEPNQPQGVNIQSAIDLSRFRKAAYGSGATIPAPPCPRNYLFSCQPNLAPVACAAPQTGSAAAYSAPIPTYVTFGVPHPVGFNGYQ